MMYLILNFQDPKFWSYRPLSELMVHAASDDVRFLPYVYYKMMEKLNEQSLWLLAVRGALYCRCFCFSGNDVEEWPSLPSNPGFSIYTTIVCLLGKCIDGNTDLLC